ncbi:phospholipase D-like domain-containing protein [Cupriavidus sp. UYPR2.512]|uniref:phospholipase D-like domain-containing protein n=1 Tax=Cupriavidus sp. UYPR2.512 TaxID=1080187 RepID=UPI001E3AAF0C|nr:phospholipase D-like domain-containing protein [Cupriavidus sp. UYPR2.512]
MLAFDWPDGADLEDFLGFAIERKPGFEGKERSWLPNRLGFNGPISGAAAGSNLAPIQKFYWWDARINTADRGRSFTYRIVPVTGQPNNPTPQDAQAATVQVAIPEVKEHGITTHFNRAVVSSQAFAKEFPDISTKVLQTTARAWLANGMEHAVPDFLDGAVNASIEGAIYHLTDRIWIVSAMRQYGGALSLTYNQTTTDHTSDDAIQDLTEAGRPADAFTARTQANIMHNKFLVRVGPSGQAEAVLAGSANFTSEGLSAQANVLHAFESPELASLYLARKRLLDGDPSLHDTQQAQTGWSGPLHVGDAVIRAFFPPEPKNKRESLDAIIAAIEQAEHSVVLCAYDPTDMPLLHAVEAAATRGLMVWGLVNRVPAEEPTGDAERGDVAAKLELWRWSNTERSVVGFDAFRASDTPTDFLPELVLWPDENPKIMVRVHHKFVVVDAEGKSPVIFTGSANFSGNSLHNNDENLLEITACPRLAGAYFAEFMRLYEHYRARFSFERRQHGESSAFTLTSDNSWNRKYFVDGSAFERARIAMAAQVNS